MEDDFGKARKVWGWVIVVFTAAAIVGLAWLERHPPGTSDPVPILHAGIVWNEIWSFLSLTTAIGIMVWVPERTLDTLGRAHTDKLPLRTRFFVVQAVWMFLLIASIFIWLKLGGLIAVP